MDENNQEQHHNHHYHNGECFLCKHPWLKLLLTGLMTLIGAYLAFYFVTDWHFKRMLDPVVQMRKMDRMIQKEEHQMHKFFDKEMRKEKNLERKAGEIIHVEKTEDAYKIVIDLKPFNNDEKNVTVTREGDSLTVNMAGEIKKQKKELTVSLTQKFIFPDDADLDDISKFKDGNKYFIVVPIRD
ncbi:MAG: Hsp20 family protein [Candidatus Gastranaerophilales bacterium]|nr:Hsp20 family protein [Candidatus Gastranaerophilales bacterium]